jgi:hypothetical protein
MSGSPRKEPRARCERQDGRQQQEPKPRKPMHEVRVIRVARLLYRAQVAGTGRQFYQGEQSASPRHA